MKIGNIDLGDRPLLLAPMEDVTDAGFRWLCRKMGAAMVYSEFVAADALVRSVKSTYAKLAINEEERPTAIQIYGRFVDTMVEAAKIVEEVARPDVLDINFGCPVKRVASKGAGAGMLRNIPLMLDITKKIVKAVKLPVTVKTRLGWDNDSIVIDTLAEQLQDCGIQALTIHGRTRAQMYKGVSDWQPIAMVKRNPRIHIPIIGNGDVCTPEQAYSAFETYGVDAVMVGRATFGQPWIFREMSQRLHSNKMGDLPQIGEYKPLSVDWKLDVLKSQVEESINRIDEYRGILHVRRHLAASPIFKGIPDFKNIRIAILRAETKDDLFDLIETARPLVNKYSVQ